MGLLVAVFSPDGVGQAGNFRQLIIVLGVMSGAGIFNGITKYVAEYHQDPLWLRLAVGTALSMVLGFSILLALVFPYAAKPIGIGLLFGHTDYVGVVPRYSVYSDGGIASYTPTPVYVCAKELSRCGGQRAGSMIGK